MLWLNPVALLALGAVAAPVLIHILVQRRAERFPFPTLRFLRQTRLAAIRRHVLEDLPLLAVRAALIASAVAAFAAPLIVTSGRRQLWNERIIRAVVTDATANGGAEPPPPAARGRFFQQQAFANSPLADGVRRAVAWLETVPPARREIVIASALPIGSITRADLDTVPDDIGVRFERSGMLPTERTTAGGRLLTPAGVLSREVTLTADRTAVRDEPTDDRLGWPIDVVSSQQDRAAVDAAVAAVLSQHVWAAAPDRRARVILVAGNAAAGDRQDDRSGALPIRQPWMASAVVRMSRNQDLQTAGARVAAGLSDPRFASAPWQALASAADGRPLAAAAGLADRLLIASAAPAAHIATPI